MSLYTSLKWVKDWHSKQNILPPKGFVKRQSKIPFTQQQQHNKSGILTSGGKDSGIVLSVPLSNIPSKWSIMNFCVMMHGSGERSCINLKSKALLFVCEISSAVISHGYSHLSSDSARIEGETTHHAFLTALKYKFFSFKPTLFLNIIPNNEKKIKIVYHFPSDASFQHSR